jgi:hypothetical protein
MRGRHTAADATPDEEAENWWVSERGALLDRWGCTPAVHFSWRRWRLVSEGGGWSLLSESCVYELAEHPP